MSDTNKNRLNDPELDADLAHLADEDKSDPKPARVGSAEAPDAGPDADVERETVGGGTASSRDSSVEGVDDVAARRDAMRDATS